MGGEPQPPGGRSRRRRVAGLLALLLLGLAGASGAASRPDPAGEGRSLPRVTMITDSVGGVLYWASDARAELSDGLDLLLETRACRKLVSEGCYAYDQNPPSALETIRELGPQLGSLVIVDVGYNDQAETYAASLDTIMAALLANGVHHVVWVTLEEMQGVWVRINEEIRAAPRRWPQLVVADWAPQTVDKPDWFGDTVHMNGAGALAFARFLRPIVLAACGSDCQPPQPATTAAPAAPAPVPQVTLLPPRISGESATIRWHGNEPAVSFDVAVRRSRWRTLATRLEETSFRIEGSPELRILARVRGRDADGIAGPWSAPQPIRFGA